MRLSSIFSASIGVGAALANIIPGPFDVVAITPEGDVWNTTRATVSHGAIILSLYTGDAEPFNWDNATSRIVPAASPSLHSSIGGLGSVLVFWGPSGPNDPGSPDRPVKQIEIDDEVYLVAPENEGEKFQWSSRFEAEHLPSGFAVEEPGSAAANAALLIKPRIG